MEPIEVLGLAGVAAAGWALGRASKRSDAGDTRPGDRIAAAGTRVSRNTAFGVAAVGSRALMLSAAGLATGGSLAARGIGTGVDMVVTVGDVATRTVRRLGPPRANGTTRAVDSGTEAAPLVEQTNSGLVVPVDANTTV